MSQYIFQFLNFSLWLMMVLCFELLRTSPLLLVLPNLNISPLFQ